MPSLFGGEEEGVLQTRQPLGLEAEPCNRGLPITGSQSPGPNKTKQNRPILRANVYKIAFDYSPANNFRQRRGPRPARSTSSPSLIFTRKCTKLSKMALTLYCSLLIMVSPTKGTIFKRINYGKDYQLTLIYEACAFQ